MNALEKARKYLRENQELFQFMKDQPPGKPIEMPRDLASAILVEHLKNVGERLEGIVHSATESFYHSGDTAPKIYI
ncbi:hypothetical protein KY308_00930 [Candidatus Woesearchaeota archaeon]|nr:hypothetical protein [Candidatus Woesearchaeota archaeon]